MDTLAIKTEVPTESLKMAVKAEAERRDILKEFVSSQLTQGADYGVIKIAGRDTRPCLFKPGMEKIFSLFNMRSELVKDEETLSMISSKDVIAYVCKLFRNDTIVGEGRGACEVKEKGRINDAIKIAEKRARMDACLNLGFSEYFTQDLEDRPVEDALTARGVTTGDTNDGELPTFYRKPATPLPVPARTPLISAGETKDLEFMVLSKELKTAQSGTKYAILTTDIGPITAFNNSMNKFEQDHVYQAQIEARTWNGKLSLAVVVWVEEVPQLDDHHIDTETEYGMISPGTIDPNEEINIDDIPF